MSAVRKAFSCMGSFVGGCCLCACPRSVLLQWNTWDNYWADFQCFLRYLGGVAASKTLHVGDQFLSAGANDFKARNACTTAWIASPAETVGLLDELAELLLDGDGTG